MAHLGAKDFVNEAASRITPQQLEEIKKTAEKLTQRAVLTLVKLTLGSRSGTKLLIHDITEEFPDKQCVPLQMETDKFAMKLNITLTIVNTSDEPINTMLPEGADENEVVGQFMFLKRMAIAYWREFKETNAALFNRITVLCDDIDWTDLQIDEDKPTTMYFDKNFSKRISVFTYWVDANGRPFVKKNTK